MTMAAPSGYPGRAGIVLGKKQIRTISRALDCQYAALLEEGRSESEQLPPARDRSKP
jgi:hypothetical protein